MKSITLKIELPKWAKWTAIDSCGVLIAFENEPERINGVDASKWPEQFGSFDWSPGKGLMSDILQFDGQKYKGWQKSKRKVK